MYNISSKIAASLVIGAMCVSIPATSFAAYGTVATAVPVATAQPIATVVNSTGSGSSSSSSSSSNSGGGGGGLAGTFGSISCTPVFSGLTPDRNEIVGSNFSNISFNVSKNVDPTSLVASINGVDIAVSAEKNSDGSYSVQSTEINSSLINQGSNLLRINATGSLFGSCKTSTAYIVRVDSNGNTATGTPSPTPTIAVVASSTPAPLSIANACDKGEAVRDGSHDPAKTYDDTTGHWAEEYILDLTRRCIVHGRELGEKNDFVPEGVFNRAEAAKVVIKAFGGSFSQSVATAPFNDVPGDAWFAPYVETAKAQGRINGYGDGSFGPANGLTRVEALAMIARASGANISSYSGDTSFADVSPNIWYAPYVEWAIEKGIADANNANFNPGSIISRGEYSMIVSLSIR